MTGVHDLPLFVLAGLLLNLTPGPGMAYIAAGSALAFVLLAARLAVLERN